MAAVDPKRLAEGLQSDLRLLSNEARKRHPQIKEAAETCCERVRNIALKGEANFIPGLANASIEIVHPLLMGCDSKSPKLVQISLSAIQRLISHQALDQNGARSLVNELHSLAEAGVEELKLLQTITLLLTCNTLVQSQLLAKALVICFRMHLTGREAVIVNAASATVRQLVATVFERLMPEIGSVSAVRQQNVEASLGQMKVGPSVSVPPASLQPLCADAYMLFQDLCILLSRDHAVQWLPGLQTLPRDLGLDLIENALVQYESLFREQQEFTALLKDQVCPLVIRLFSPNVKTTGAQQTEKPSFPITARLLRVICVLITKYARLLSTECEIFLSLIMKFLNADKALWQRALSLEVLHKIVTEPDLLRIFCENYDMKPHSTKVLQDIITSLGGFVQASFVQKHEPQGDGAFVSNDVTSTTQLGVGTSPTFYYRGVWIPLACIPMSQGCAKPFYLDMLDKGEPLAVPDGYCLSVTYTSLLDACYSVHKVVLETQNAEKSAMCLQMAKSTCCGMLAALTSLLEASLDENVTESLLRALQMLVSVTCRLKLMDLRDSCLNALCKASLPPNYMFTVFGLSMGKTADSAGFAKTHSRSPSQEFSSSQSSSELAEVHLSQIVAYGVPCPTPSLPATLQNVQLGITTKNVQTMRALLSVAHVESASLSSAWHLVLATLQHFCWLLSLNPGMAGSGGRVADQVPKTDQLTTAVIADIPVLQAMITKLFECTKSLDEVNLHHVLDALCKLSHESMLVAEQGRDPSYFGIVRLLQLGLVNMQRLNVFWKLVTGHLLEASAHPHARLRAEGADALCTLIKAALQLDAGDIDVATLQRLFTAPLYSMSDLVHDDVRLKQMECTAIMLRDYGSKIREDIWPTVLAAINSVVASDHKFSDTVIQAGFGNSQMVVADFLGHLNLACVQQVIEMNGKYGSQHQDLNISLTAVGLLWNISDFLSRNSTKFQLTNGQGGLNRFDALWLCLYTCLSELCADMRAAVRKSACQTLFQTITAHGALLEQQTWSVVLWQILFPLLDKVRALTTAASNTRSESHILMHHSRDTESKQWAETHVLTLSGVVKVFNLKRAVLMKLSDFEKAWTLILQYIENSGKSDNGEISLAALKSFQDLLQLSVKDPDQYYPTPPVQKPPPTSKSRRLSESTGESVSIVMDAPPFPLELWATAWKVWLSMAHAACGGAPPEAHSGSAPLRTASYLHTLLQTFPPLFEHVERRFDLADMEQLAKVLQGMTVVPLCSDQAPFIMPVTAPDITPTQLAILDVLQVVAKKAMAHQSKLRVCLPTVFAVLCKFAGFGCRFPSQDMAEWVLSSFVPFAERSMKVMSELYVGCAQLGEVIEKRVLTEIVKALHLPLALKYTCPSQSTWKLAHASLLTVLQVGLPVSRQHVTQFESLWPELGALFEDFLFTKSQKTSNVTFQEIREHEMMDKQVVDVIRRELLPYASTFPESFLNQIIHLLNRGSVLSSDSKDVLAINAAQELREDFARCCFDTLLQFSYTQPDVVSSAQSAVGARAVASLLQRCRDVLEKYVRDERMQGQMPMPRHRVLEINSVLKALVILISSLRDLPAHTVNRELWQDVIRMHPCLVECVPCRTTEIQPPLVAALKAYGALLRPPM